MKIVLEKADFWKAVRAGMKQLHLVPDKEGFNITLTLETKSMELEATYVKIEPPKEPKEPYKPGDWKENE